MPLAISTAQLTQYQNLIKREGVEGARRVYDSLYASGYNYAGWAAGVARGDSIAGQAALRFMQTTALMGISGQAAQSLTPAQIDQIRVNMALGYVGELLIQADKNGGLVSQDLGFEETKDFHREAFEKHGLSLANWTLTIPMDLIARTEGNQAVEDLWVRIRDTGGDYADATIINMIVAQRVGRLAFNPDPSISGPARQWMDLTPGVANFEQLARAAGVTMDSLMPAAASPGAGVPANPYLNLFSFEAVLRDMNGSSLIDSQAYRDMTQWISQQLLSGTPNAFPGGYEGPENPYGYTPTLAPIGAFYESSAPEHDNASSIADRTPVLLDSQGKAVAANRFLILDRNRDNKLAGTELDGLSTWTDLNENGVLDAGERQTLAQKGITQIKSADYDFYTAGNSVVADAALATPTRQSGTLTLPNAVTQRAVQAQPAAMAAVLPVAPMMNYRLLRDLDNRYWIDANNWIDWSASQVKISSDKKTLTGTDGNDSFDVNYWAAYTQYFNVNLASRAPAP